MRNVFQALVMSTVASVMFSCSSNDSENLLNEVLQKGELHVDVKSDQGEANLNSNVDAKINNLHLFVFKNKDGQDDNGNKEDYKSIDFSNGSTPSVFSSKPTQGHKDLVVVANHLETKDDKFADIPSLLAFYNQKAYLSTQAEGNFTMVGEQRFEVKGGLNETTVNLTRLVAKVVLKPVAVANDLQSKITPVRAFMMNVNGVSWVRGTSTGDAEYNEPIFNGYRNDGTYAGGYLSQLSSSFSDTPNNSIFYAFENKGKKIINSVVKESDKTMLCIEATYTKNDGTEVPVYYSIVVKTGEEAKILRNNVYTLSATIKRPGSLVPEIPSDKGDLEVSISVDEWIYNYEQSESFE